jgi:AraC family transcriptional regulator
VAELDGNARHAAEAADSLARLLLVRLTRRRATEMQRAAALSPTRLARLREYVAAHLAERLLVADLAAAVGLAPNHFAHVFTAQMGLPPHQFVVEMRLQRAMELLAHTRLSLAEVAATCGFASQQHLTVQMRQRMGTTPGRYRQARSPGP